MGPDPLKAGDDRPPLDAKGYVIISPLRGEVWERGLNPPLAKRGKEGFYDL